MFILLTLLTLVLFVLLILLRQSYQREELMHRAIKTVCLQKLDNLCWMDFYDLAEAANVPMPDLRLLPREVMLRNCERYVDCLMQDPGNRKEATKRYHGVTRKTADEECNR